MKLQALLIVEIIGRFCNQERRLHVCYYHRVPSFVDLGTVFRFRSCAHILRSLEEFAQLIEPTSLCSIND